MVRSRHERTVRSAIDNKTPLKISENPLNKFQPKIKQKSWITFVFFFFNIIKHQIRLLSVFSLKETSITNIFIATIQLYTTLLEY